MKTRVSFLFDEGKAKCKAHCSINISQRVNDDVVEYAPKQVCIVGGHLALAILLDRSHLAMRKWHKHDANRIACRPLSIEGGGASGFSGTNIIVAAR